LLTAALALAAASASAQTAAPPPVAPPTFTPPPKLQLPAIQQATPVRPQQLTLPKPAPVPQLRVPNIALPNPQAAHPAPPAAASNSVAPKTPNTPPSAPQSVQTATRSLPGHLPMAGVDWPVPPVTTVDRGDGKFCGPMLKPQSSGGPFSPDVVCQCAQEYLAYMGNDSAALRKKYQDFIGKTITKNASTSAKSFSELDIDGIFSAAEPLQDYAKQRRISTCEKWTADRPKMDGDIAERKSLLDRIATLQTQASGLFGQMREAQKGIGPRKATNDQAVAQARELNQKAADVNRQANDLKRQLPAIEKRLAQYPVDAEQAKSGAYRSVQAAFANWWNLYRIESRYRAAPVGAEQLETQTRTQAAAKDENVALNQKWDPVWVQRVREFVEREDANLGQNAQIFTHVVFDAAGFFNDELPSCRRLGALYAQESDQHAQEMASIASRFRDTFQRIRSDLMPWEAFSGQDGWPEAGVGGANDVSFGETARRVFEYDYAIRFTLGLGRPEYSFGGPAIPRSVPSSKFNITVDSRGVIANPGELTGGVGDDSNRPVAVPEDPNIAAFRKEHPDCNQWYGAIANGSIAHGGEIWDDSKRLDYEAYLNSSAGRPADWGNPDRYIVRPPNVPPVTIDVVFEPLKRENYSNIMFASGADKTQRP